MNLSLMPAHRLAQINYLPRAASFAYSFLVFGVIAAERGYGGWESVFGVLTFLVYPHLAYLHARIAVNSKRAEFLNLAADSVLLGMWAAQVRFALWPTCALLMAIGLNNAACGERRTIVAFLLFVLGAAALGAAHGFEFIPVTGPVVTGLCFFGIIVYVTTVGLILYHRNLHTVRTRSVLRKSEEQFRFIAENAGDLVAVLDSEGRFRYASESHRALFDPDALGEGKAWLDLVHAEDRAQAGGFLKLLWASKRSDVVRLRMLPLRGPWRSVECHGNVVDENGGKAQMAVLVCRDLSARARLEIEMRLAGRAFDRLADAALVTDNMGCIEFVNHACTALIGYRPEELVGRMVGELVAQAQPDALIADIWSVVGREGVWRGKFSGRARDGSLRAIAANVSAVRDDNGVPAHYVWILQEDSKVRDLRAA